MMKVSLFYFCLVFLFLFSCSAEVTTSKTQFETLDYDTSAHDSSSTSSLCSRAPITNGSEKGAPLRLEVVHRFGPCVDQEGSKKEGTAALSLDEIFAKDQLRVQSIQVAVAAAVSASAAGEDYDNGPTQLPAHRGESLGTANYVVTISLGTPKHALTLLIDTGSVLTWTQCLPCNLDHCYKQDEPLFEPSASSTYSLIPCTSHYCTELDDYKRGGPGCFQQNNDCPYKVQYGSGGSSTGLYSTEKLTLSWTNVFYGFRFGCGNENSLGIGSTAKFAGVLGLGKGPLSFVSQTQATFSGIFSYCLPPDSSSPGFISFGGEEYYKQMEGTMVFTPLVSGPTDHYYIDIIAMRVGGYRLPIEDSVFTTTGAIIDSGTVLTRLPPKAYMVLAEEFTKQMNALGHPNAPPEQYFFDTCFQIAEHSNKKIPKVSFVFKGGAAVNLAASGILYPIKFRKDKSCLAFLSNRSPSALAVLGNTQQTTLEVMYDLRNNKLGFRNNLHCV